MNGLSTKTAFLFSGGGSQKVGMGADLMVSCQECHATIDAADRVLGFPLSRIMREGPKQDLDPAVISHPAVVALSVAQARHLVARGVVPDAVVGHSLGQYSALVVAGALGYPSAIRLVIQRARLMQLAVPVGSGAMMAIVGLDRETVYKACAAARTVGVVNVACHNAPSQTVISGDRRAVEAAAGICEDAGGGAVLLPISVASHCDLLLSMKDVFAKTLESTEWHDPEMPVIDNVTAQPLTKAAQIKAALVEQLTSPVLFEESVRYLSGMQFQEFVECGPGTSLTDLAKRITRARSLSFEQATRDLVLAI